MGDANGEADNGEREMTILGLGPLPCGNALIALQNGDEVLPIVIGPNEARAISDELWGEKSPRPMTHDLIVNLLVGLKGKLVSVEIYKLEDDTFYAYLNVTKGEEGQAADSEAVLTDVLRIDCRTSDGIAIAVRVGCPIYVSQNVLDEAGQPAADYLPGPEE